MPLALAFNPIFAYIAVAISGLLGLSRLMLAGRWANHQNAAASIEASC